MEKGMKRFMKMLFVAMTVVTVVGVAVIVYANKPQSNIGKEPIDYNIMVAYFAEPTENPAREWYTPEQLGIALEPLGVANKLDVWIVDEQKALPWMKEYGCDVPFSLYYEGKFYDIHGLHVTPGLPEHVKNVQPLIGGAIGAGWLFTGLLFLKWRGKK